MILHLSILAGFCLFVSLFCICILGRSVMSFCYGIIALYSRCLLGLSDIASLITWAKWSRNVPYVDLFESWLLYTHQWVGLSLKVSIFEDWPQSQYKWELTSQSRICPSMVLCLPICSLGYDAFGNNWVFLWCGLNPPPDMLGSVASWKGLCQHQ